MSETLPLRERSPILRLLRGRPLRLPRPVVPVINSSTLPVEIRDLVTRIVRGVGGTRAERADVSRELLAHFDDAIARGVASANAITEFGDERQAIKLLRRAVRRKRGFIWKSWWWSSRAVVSLFALAIFAYGVLAARYYLVKPTIAVDPVAKLQSLTPIGAPDERAWPVYREGLASLHVVDRETWHDPTRWRDTHPLTSREPGTDAWVAASNALAAHQDDLATLRRAAALPYLGIELNRFTPEDIAFYGRYFTPPSEDNGIWSRSAYSILLPHLAELQVAARWLACDAMHASADGDGARAVDDLEAIVNVARQLRRPLYIDQLVSMACLALATDVAGTIVAKMPDGLSATDLARLATTFEAAHNTDLRIDFEGERIAFEDFLQRIYSDDGNGDGHVVSAALESADRFREFGVEPPPAFVRAAAPALTLAAPSRREIHTRFEERVRAAEQLAKRPAWEWTQADLKRVAGPPNDAVADLFVLMRVGMLLNGSGLERSVDLPVHLRQRIDVVRLAIALRRFEREHGEWPASIESLDARLVASTHDRSDGKPLRYAVHEGKPVIWSIGADRIDDHLSVIAPGNVDIRRSAPLRGDVILWPPIEEKAEGFPTLLVF